MISSLESGRSSRLFEVDAAVSAQFPDPEERSELFALVTRHMVHGPCGAFNRDAPCMTDGACAKHYPKPFATATTAAEDRYPKYRRRDNGRGFEKNGFFFDNRHVVPYNAWLLAKYECHLNVEVVSSIRSIKYMYKYTYKGHDRAGVEVRQDDEVLRYLDTRYVGPPEGCWRLFHFEMYGRPHCIERLAVHLPDMQSVNFTEGEELEALQRDYPLNLFAEQANYYRGVLMMSLGRSDEAETGAG